MTQTTRHRASGQTRSLSQWLDYLTSIHPKSIELGLERVAQVLERLKLDFSASALITVAGTNGKGTTCAMLEQAAILAGKSVSVYSSPHLLDYRERVRVNGQMLSESAHCRAFAQVEAARADTPLTYFEFGTLAALCLIAEQKCDFVLLEVGLGGRLDAVNALDPQIAVITSIDLDHQDWLGDTREQIGAEKAGIFRSGIPVVIGDPEPPESVRQAARSLHTVSYWQGKDFACQAQDGQWHWTGWSKRLEALPKPNIPMQNAATALAVLQLLDFSLTQEQYARLMQGTALPGRSQIIHRRPTVMLDVAHNPQATRYLLKSIQAHTYDRLHLVVAMLADKDIEQSLQPFKGLSANWYLAELDEPRGAAAEQLKSILAGQQKMLLYESVPEAYRQAQEQASSEDLIVVFGSFYTVARVLALQAD